MSLLRELIPHLYSGANHAVWNEGNANTLPGTLYPTIYASPCTKINFGNVQTNHDVVKVRTS